MTRKRLLTFIAAALLALAFGAAFFPVLSRADQAQAARADMADFTLKTLDGKKAQLSDYKGKVVVVSFWATWCAPCKQELGHLQKFRDAHGGEGFEVLAITTDDASTLSEVRSLVKRKRWNMPVLLDPEGAVLALHNPRGSQPFSLFIDRAGRLADKHEGFAAGDEEKYLTTIKKLLAEKP